MGIIPLKSGLDYPNTYRSFVEMFPDDVACAAYLVKLSWTEGFICPACKTKAERWMVSRGRLACQSCRHHTSATPAPTKFKYSSENQTWEWGFIRGSIDPVTSVMNVHFGIADNEK